MRKANYEPLTFKLNINRKVKKMPREIFDTDEFLELSAKASECRIKKIGDNTKLKLRTPRMLYTINLDTAEAEELIKKIQCSKIEL